MEKTIPLDSSGRVAPRRPRLSAAVAAMLVFSTTVTACGYRGVQGSPVARPTWHPQQEMLLSSSMSTHPVPGWRRSVAELGIAEPVAEQKGALRFGDGPDPLRSQPFIGSIEDRAYFMITTTTGQQRWWLAGLGVRDGRPLFAPLALPAASEPMCFLNGPNRVLCMASGEPDTAWVVDATTGSVLYHGPTDLSLNIGHLGVEQVGDYAVAGTMDQGIYGIGDTADTTWFVPGDGRVGLGLGWTNFAPPVLATQVTGGRGSDRMVVFSLRDGKVLDYGLPDDLVPMSAVVYPGGFAVEVASTSSAPTPHALWFFDTVGKRLGQSVMSGSLDTLTRDLPITYSARRATVYSNEGFPLARITGFDSGWGVLLLGTRLFVNQSKSESGDRWQEYELTTGEEGQMCETNLSGLVGSDGTTAVFNSGTRAIGLKTRGVDIATCTERWSTTSAAGSFRTVWRANTTLVQLSDDGTELTSLVAP